MGRQEQIAVPLRVVINQELYIYSHLLYPFHIFVVCLAAYMIFTFILAAVKNPYYQRKIEKWYENSIAHSYFIMINSLEVLYFKSIYSN